VNQLYYGDNLDILRRYIQDETVDLVYLDPPFNSNATYNVLFAEHNGTKAAAQIQAFEDTWTWDEAAARSYQEAVEAGGQVAKALIAFHTLLGASNMMAYLAMMAPRLVELRRVLKPTGSIYLHCDPTASHYLKVLMDAVFGPANFRNEIVWKRTPFAGSSKARARQFPRSHDLLMFYSKGDAYFYQPILLPYEQEYFERFRNPDNDERGPYQSVLLKTYSEETLARLRTDNRIIEPKRPGVGIRYKQFLYELRGRQADDIWTDINMINPVARERLGYPTQKPEALLERIISASCPEGGLVLDPFCGCGTTIIVAHRMGRPWIGIDITVLAVNLMKERLRSAFGDSASYEVIGEPVSIQDAQALASDKPYQFQWWALGLVGARPVEGKKGADKGIDGRLYFHVGDSTTTQQVILSVKAGQNISVSHVRDLRGVIEREKAEIGVLITMQEPTQPMRKEAAEAGFYASPWGSHPRIQILTVAELLDGKRIDMPPLQQVNATYKKAPRAKQGGKQGQLGLPDDPC